MGFFDALFGGKAAAALISPLEAVPGAAAALTAFKTGKPAAAESFYQACADGGCRRALVGQLADDAGISTKEETPFDALVAAGSPFWRMVRAEYQVRVGWQARGTGHSESVTDAGWKELFRRCERAMEDIEHAAAALPEDDVPWAVMMLVARGLSDEELGARAFQGAIERVPNSFSAARARVTWLSPRWFGSEEAMMEYARGEAARVKTGELASLPIFAFDDLRLYRIAFDQDQPRADAELRAALEEIEHCCARSCDDQPVTYATGVIRQYAAWLFWRAGEPGRTRAQLAKCGNIFDKSCWGTDPLNNYRQVRQKLGL